MTSDLDLLKRFVGDHSQDAFTELVNRHVDLVYSAARRQVRSPHLAEEITQSVFTDLARNADKLNQTATGNALVLTAWLYQVARRTAIDVIRHESRRQLREQVVLELNDMNAAAHEWTQIEPLLDDALAALEETDRTAILLRFFENKNLREVGESLNISDDAAQKRVTRAVERLREFFSKRNVTIGASGLAVLISANAVQAAPVGLAAVISAAAVLTGTTAATSTVITATKTIAMTTLQKTFVTAALITTIGTGLFEAHQAAQLRAQNQMLQQAQAPLADQVRQLQAELGDATNRLASLIAENSRWQANSNELELLKLRGEVGRLLEANRQLAAGTNDSRDALVKSWLAREDQLRQLARQYPGKTIPEFQLLSENQWLNAAMGANFDTDTNIQQDLANLRRTAENNFASQTETALQNYSKANNGQFPTDLSQLQPYYSSPMDEAILQRWEIVPGSDNPSVSVGPTVITEISPVDASLDSRWSIGPNGYGSGNYESTAVANALSTIAPAMKAYAADNNGQQPTDPSQIQPYLTTPAQQSAFQTLLKLKGANNP